MKNKIFKFKVSIDKGIYRILEIKGSESLYDFAAEITDSFDFDFDHCFGFFSKIKGHIFDSDEVYELFQDLKDCDGTPGAKGVKKEYLYNVFHKGKKMTFYFDYGDDWRFLVECLDVYEPEAQKRYPKVLESKGAVEQYPDPDEDYDDDDYDDDEDEEEFDSVINQK